jgi:hypothetical protein
MMILLTANFPWARECALEKNDIPILPYRMRVREQTQWQGPDGRVHHEEKAKEPDVYFREKRRVRRTVPDGQE